MAALADIKARRRADYKFSLEYRTRWMDNDMYDVRVSALLGLV